MSSIYDAASIINEVMDIARVLPDKPTGVKDITENGDYDIFSYESVVVNVPGTGPACSSNVNTDILTIDNYAGRFGSSIKILVNKKTAVTEVTSDTTCSCTITPFNTGWVLATVTTRSDTTYPDDWTLLHECDPLGTDASNQRMAILCIESDGSEITCNITQAEAERMYINLIALEGIEGFEYHQGTEVRDTDINKVAEVNIHRPEYDNIIWCCSANLWYTTSPYGVWQCSPLEPICLNQTSTQPRQANFIDEDNTVETRHFVAGSASGSAKKTAYIIDCVEFII